MTRQGLEVLPLAAYGIARGITNVYLRPAISNLANRAVERFLGKVDMEVINQYIGEVALEDYEDERMAA